MGRIETIEIIKYQQKKTSSGQRCEEKHK